MGVVGRSIRTGSRRRGAGHLLLLLALLLGAWLAWPSHAKAAPCARYATGYYVCGAIADRYNAIGGPGRLGNPVHEERGTPDGRGRFQRFERGMIYWTSSTGPWEIYGAVLDRFQHNGYENLIGYPVHEEGGTPDGRGRFQRFERGMIYWTASTGAWEIRGAILTRFERNGFERLVGYPVHEERGTPDGRGRYQRFDRGLIYWTPQTGAHDVVDVIESRWGALGWERSHLGYPIEGTQLTPDRKGRYNRFERGMIYWSPTTGAHAVSGPILGRWAQTGYEGASLGYPIAEPGRTPDGRATFQRFQRGIIYSGPTGTHDVLDVIESRYAPLGWERSYLGYPTEGTQVTPDGRGRYNRFERGMIYWTHETGAHAVSGAILSRWAQTGYEGASLGYPIQEQGRTADNNANFQRFQRGLIYDGPTGVHEVLDVIETRWGPLGYERSYLGYPVHGTRVTPDGRGRFSRFQNGMVYWTHDTGAHDVQGPILDRWAATGYERGPLGYPVAGERPTIGGRYSMFQNGTLLHTETRGTRQVHRIGGALLDAWAASGFEVGSLGFPLHEERPTPDGRGTYIRHERGMIYWTPQTGAQLLRGAVLDHWAARGYERGALGYPLHEDRRTPGGSASYARFEKGMLYVSPAGGWSVTGRLLERWARGGYEAGLGYPTADAGSSYDSSATKQSFERGVIYDHRPTNATFAVTGPILRKYTAVDGERTLGYPQSEAIPTSRGGTRQVFQRGEIVYSGEAGVGAGVVTGQIWVQWERLGRDDALGFPVRDAEKSANGQGLVQVFTNGVLHSSVQAAGGFVLPAALSRAYAMSGGSGGTWGAFSGTAYEQADGARRYYFSKDSCFFDEQRDGSVYGHCDPSQAHPTGISFLSPARSDAVLRDYADSLWPVMADCGVVILNDVIGPKLESYKFLEFAADFRGGYEKALLAESVMSEQGNACTSVLRALYFVASATELLAQPDSVFPGAFWTQRSGSNPKNWYDYTGVLWKNCLFQVQIGLAPASLYGDPLVWNCDK